MPGRILEVSTVAMRPAKIADEAALASRAVLQAREARLRQAGLARRYPDGRLAGRCSSAAC
jgi:hypothetical protein